MTCLQELLGRLAQGLGACAAGDLDLANECAQSVVDHLLLHGAGFGDKLEACEYEGGVKCTGE